jgi:cell division FtsZ-interacting protein ZapD
MELKGYFQKLPNNKPILNKLTENNLLDLVRKRELSPEQGTSFLYNILKILQHLDHGERDAALHCIDEFISDVEDTTKLRLQEKRQLIEIVNQFKQHI